MDCCSSNSTAQTVFERSSSMDQSADRLADLLAQAPEYQEFVRIAQLINLDPDVERISMEIRKHQMAYANPYGASIETLQADLEALPAVQAYRKAEAAVKDLFHSVDQAISAQAGVAFAPNAVRSGCG